MKPKSLDKKKVAKRKAAKKKASPRTRPALDAVRWELRLYVAGETPRSIAALENLERICREHLDGRYYIEVVDLLKRPQLARDDQIVAIPTLIRRLPPPLRKVIGDLSRTADVLVGLQLAPKT